MYSTTAWYLSRVMSTFVPFFMIFFTPNGVLSEMERHDETFFGDGGGTFE